MKRHLPNAFWLKSKVSFILVPMCLMLTTLLAACAAPPAKLSVKEEIQQYLSMTYRTFQERYDAEAERLHGQFFSASLPETALQAVFQADQYDEENAVFLLGEDSVLHRLEGELGAMVTGISGEMSAEHFAQSFAQEDHTPGYGLAVGGDTAYYVADRYLSVQLENHITLQVALDASDTITPDSHAWLLWESASVDDAENVTFVTLDSSDFTASRSDEETQAAMLDRVCDRLTEVIAQMDGVAKASMDIQENPDGVLQASVFMVMDEGEDLTDSSRDAILSMISGALPDLSADNITMVMQDAD